MSMLHMGELVAQGPGNSKSTGPLLGMLFKWHKISFMVK